MELRQDVETTDTLAKKKVDPGNGKKVVRRVGTPAQWKERNDLQVANTAPAQRSRVVAELATKNGH